MPQSRRKVVGIAGGRGSRHGFSGYEKQLSRKRKVWESPTVQAFGTTGARRKKRWYAILAVPGWSGWVDETADRKAERWFLRTSLQIHCAFSPG